MHPAVYAVPVDVNGALPRLFGQLWRLGRGSRDARSFEAGGSAVVDEPSAALAFLMTQYQDADNPVVARFLSEHADALPLLISTREHIRASFGEADVLLEVMDDPDELLQPALFAVVRTGLSVAAGRQALKRFDSDWWLPQVHATQLAMAVTIDFV